MNLSPEAKIDTVSTKKLANAIARQEGWRGDFPKVEEKPKDKVIAAGEPLYKTHTNKRELRYGEPIVPLTGKAFKTAQSNLSSIVSNKFSKLTASEKRKYKGSGKEATRKFVKDKFEQWLNESGNLRKPKWKTKGKYAVEDFKYFIPTKVDASDKVNKNPDANIYTLYYPGAFKEGALGGIMKVPDSFDDGYAEFAKDFDAFRKYLQES